MDHETTQGKPLEPPTLDRLIADIEALCGTMNAPPSVEDGWFTVADWARERNCSEQHVRDVLKPLIEDQMIEITKHVNRLYYRLRNGKDI